jgi:predicted dehydrogenase
MEQRNLSRRGFLERSLAALTAGAGLPLWYAREVLSAEQDKAAQAKKPVAANDKLVMGAIGIGGPQTRGLAIMNDALNLKRGIQYVAVCDVDRSHRERAAKILKDRGMEAKAYEDFRALLDRKDIDAVTIATPDHWHTLIAIDALRKGKDVYCEKPLTLTIDEGKALVKVARETDRVFQVGSQQRSDARFRLACELVRNGRIGQIKRIETRIGPNPVSPSLPVVPVPEGMNWDFWLGPTPKVDYVHLQKGNRGYTRCHHEFRWWYDYSGGKMTDWGAHHNDIAQWGLGMDRSGPVAVEATGDEPSKEPNSYNCHPHFTIRYTYANGALLLCTSDGENGIKFEGDNGWIFVNRSKITASDQEHPNQQEKGKREPSKILDEPLPASAVRLYQSANHMGNFVDCVHSRKRPICDVEVGHRSVSVCHLGVIALRTGKKLTWDPAAERFAGDAEANKWLSREMRAPWKLDV